MTKNKKKKKSKKQKNKKTKKERSTIYGGVLVLHRKKKVLNTYAKGGKMITPEQLQLLAF